MFVIRGLLSSGLTKFASRCPSDFKVKRADVPKQFTILHSDWNQSRS